MNRRAFLQAVGCGSIAAATQRWARCAETTRPPNIVVILADDMGFGDLACQNPDAKVATPNLDALATQGMRFTDAHSPSAVCTPTRYGVLTGTYCWRSPLKQSVLWPWDGPLIGKDTPTLGGMLQGAGYDTACIGKWHLGWSWPTPDGSSINDRVPLGKWDTELRNPFGAKVDFTRPIEDGPTTRGFSYYYGDDVPNFAPYTWIENNRVQALPTEQKPAEMFGTPGPMAPAWDLTAVMPGITQRATEFIRAEPGAAPFNKRADRPFFLYFPLTAPHTPIAPAEPFQGKSEAGRYGDYVQQVDWTAGEIMRALEETGQAENTLLVFTSDNGSPARDGENMAGAPRSVLHYGHNPSHIYRGIKADIWDGGHRVPFLARWPGQIPAGAVSDQLMCHTDLMATISAAAGCLLPDSAVDSYNLLPAMRHESTPPIRDAIVHHSIDGMFALRQGKWKLILGKGSGGWTKSDESDAPPAQLYDMTTDPAEKTNLYEAHPEIVERLEKLLRKYQTTGRSTPGDA